MWNKEQAHKVLANIPLSIGFVNWSSGDEMEGILRKDGGLKAHLKFNNLWHHRDIGRNWSRRC